MQRDKISSFLLQYSNDLLNIYIWTPNNFNNELNYRSDIATGDIRQYLPNFCIVFH